MQASKNYELFCKTKINLHCHTLIFFYVYWFIYSDMVRSIRGFLMISLFFFGPIPPLVNESSISRYLEFSAGVISLSQCHAISKIELFKIDLELFVRSLQKRRPWDSTVSFLKPQRLTVPSQRN